LRRPIKRCGRCSVGWKVPAVLAIEPIVRQLRPVAIGIDHIFLQTVGRVRIGDIGLFSTGYTEDEVVKHGVRRDEVALIEKPFRSHALAGKVRELLDRA